MSAQDVQAEILDPMQRLYLPPRNMEEGQQAQALREYIEALQQFQDGDLRDAWRKVRDTHVSRSWPLPAAFVKAASETRRERNELSGDRARKAEADLRREQAWETWKAISRTQMARDAVRYGVAWSLKHAILYHLKKPEEISLRELASGKASAERQAARIEAYQPLVNLRGQETKPLNARDRELALLMWNSILAHETRTAAEINYGVAEREAA